MDTTTNAAENRNTITLQIGTLNDPVTFHIRQTRAPRAYDGMGTIQVASWDGAGGATERVVLIRDGHLRWQEGRYSSGLYASVPTDYPDPEHLVAEEIWKRITGDSAQ